jgi:hypothetical protein
MQVILKLKEDGIKYLNISKTSNEIKAGIESPSKKKSSELYQFTADF